MPTFIDESGDPGFKLGRSDYFQLCAVTLHSANVAEEVRQAIRRLKFDLKLPADREFVSVHAPCALGGALVG